MKNTGELYRVQSINYNIMPATKVAGAVSATHDFAQVVNVRGTSTSEAIYYHSRPCPFGSSIGNRLNINNYEILAACHMPASLDPAPPFRFDPSSRARREKGVNALNYNKEEKRRREKYNRGQRVARCALPISRLLMECDRF